MTHNDIYTKFMIEYDKANVTSSYPSFTKYEIATILNKAYLALIAQKVTGNNIRQAQFEADMKAISDIQALVNTTTIRNTNAIVPQNGQAYSLPTDFLYYVSGYVYLGESYETVDLISHETAKRFMQTGSNRPWIKNAVAYIEDNKIVILYDNYEHDLSGNVKDPNIMQMTYIREPQKFDNSFSEDKDFELNDTMAEELISLGIVIALENIESQRLQTKAQMRGLEA